MLYIYPPLFHSTIKKKVFRVTIVFVSLLVLHTDLFAFYVKVNMSMLDVKLLSFVLMCQVVVY